MISGVLPPLAQEIEDDVQCPHDCVAVSAVGWGMGDANEGAAGDGLQAAREALDDALGSDNRRMWYRERLAACLVASSVIDAARARRALERLLGESAAAHAAHDAYVRALLAAAAARKRQRALDAARRDMPELRHGMFIDGTAAPHALAAAMGAAGAAAPAWAPDTQPFDPVYVALMAGVREVVRRETVGVRTSTDA